MFSAPLIRGTALCVGLLVIATAAESKPTPLLIEAESFQLHDDGRE